MQSTPNGRLPFTVIVTNIPAPYRNPVYQKLASMLGADRFHVIFCSQREDNRDWRLNDFDFPCSFLRPRYLTTRTGYIHFNADVISELRKLKPDVVITTGFNPTHLVAFAYACRGNKFHIPMTDGTFDSEKRLSLIHRLTRKWVYSRSRAFIGTGNGSRKLYESYGINPERVFTSHLCANNRAFSAVSGSVPRTYDFMFAGRFAPDKNPQFALDVAAGVAERLGRRMSMLLLGSGPLLEQSIRHANTLSETLETRFAGFVQQEHLSLHYASAKVFLFPSNQDTWGVVANEACAAGQAIIVSPHAGVAGELVMDGENGFVCPLNLEEWIRRASSIFIDERTWPTYSSNSIKLVAPYTYDAAAQGVWDAIALATYPT